jgi:hypothetical protein
MIPTLTAYEAQAVRDAVKEASAKAKAHRERWAVGRTHATPSGDTALVGWQGLVEGDAADVFVETFLLALRRSGGFLMFFE